MKQLFVNVMATPNMITGFGDTVQVDGGKTWKCSTSPNGTKNDEHWSKHYPWIADGSWICKVERNDKFGKCLIVNDGYFVPSVSPNPNHNNEMIINGVYFHEANKGFINPEWRGSRACLTMHRDLFDTFMEQFEVGETVMLTIRRSI
ncbi:MAG: hypothetical protein ACTSRU_14380 [Candidatus Hodarchaeales archaeon]